MFWQTSKSIFKDQARGKEEAQDVLDGGRGEGRGGWEGWGEKGTSFVHIQLQCNFMRIDIEFNNKLENTFLTKRENPWEIPCIPCLLLLLLSPANQPARQPPSHHPPSSSIEQCRFSCSSQNVLLYHHERSRRRGSGVEWGGRKAPAASSAVPPPSRELTTEQKKKKNENYFPNLSLNEVHFLNNVHQWPLLSTPPLLFIHCSTAPLLTSTTTTTDYTLRQHCSNSVASDPNYRWFWSLISGRLYRFYSFIRCYPRVQSLGMRWMNGIPSGVEWMEGARNILIPI